MDDNEGYALVAQLEKLAERFQAQSSAKISVILRPDEAQQVHDAIVFTAAYLAAEIEEDHKAHACSA